MEQNNKILESDLPIHDWYRFVLSFPPHLVRKYIKEFKLREGDLLLDPFCGTGTTLVEAKKNGINSIGFEVNPVVAMCASTKINWDVNATDLMHDLIEISEFAEESITRSTDLLKLDESKMKLLIANSISPVPLSKVLHLLKAIETKNSCYENFFKTALAKTLVFSFSNLKFGPEVGVSRKKVLDVDVVNVWSDQVIKMVDDLKLCNKTASVSSIVKLGDARCMPASIEDNTIDAVITSPPYPNEKDYSRTTRLETVILGYITSKDELRNIKKTFLRSNTRGIYKGDNDYDYVKDNAKVKFLSDLIEKKRIELQKTSGFEKLYHEVVKQYFGGIAKHLLTLKPKLKKGAHLAYVVGDQYSFFRIPIKTGELIADIAEGFGYRHVRTDLFRTRLASRTKMQINEEVVILENEN